MNLPTPEEVIEAFEVSGLTPDIKEPFTKPGHGCAVGALILSTNVIDEEDTHDLQMDYAYRLADMLLGARNWTHFGCGFDAGFEGEIRRYHIPEMAAGYEAGKAVRQWWEAKQNMPDTAPASLELEVVM